MSTEKSQLKLQARVNLQEKYTTLLAQARNIAEKANALAPVSQLPTDIIHAIFFILAHLHDDVQPPSLNWHGTYGRYKPRAASPYTGEIRRVSQVCRSWRTLALGFPGLWNATIECLAVGGGRDWASEVLQRSASAPLKVVVNTNLPREFWLPNFRNIVLNNLNRVKRLFMAISGGDAVSGFVFKQIDKRATILDTLVLMDPEFEIDDNPLGLDRDELPGRGHMDEDEDVNLYESLPFLEVAHRDYPPNLQSLHLSGYMLPLDSSLYHKLTSLRIDDFMNTSLDATAWCKFLSKLENLTSLALNDCIWPGRTHHLPPLTLPNLHTFKIAGTSQTAGRLFAHLFKTVQPALRILDVNIRNVKHDGPDFDTLLETLVTVLQRHLRVAERKTLFQFLYSNGVTISDRLCEFEGRDYMMKVRIQGRFDDVVERESSLISSLQSLLATESLQRYAQPLEIVPPLPHQVLATLTAPFVAIPGLKITLTTTFHNFKKLFYERKNDDLVPIFPLSLPQIEEINVEQMDWEVASSYTGFRRFLQWREAAGVPLQTLRFPYKIARRSQPPANLLEAQAICEGLQMISETNIICVRPTQGEDNLDFDESIDPYLDDVLEL